MEPGISRRIRTAAFALIGATAIVRLIYLARYCPFDLAPDEAYYWTWSRQLDWCYLSKGPLVAWLIRLSCEVFGPISQTLTGNEALAVRIPAVMCGVLLLAGLHTLTLQVYRSDRLAFGVIALALTMPIVAAGSSLMTIDAPFLCAWMWALVFVHRVLFRPARWTWLATGVCVLFGILAKHTMILFVPSLMLFLATTPALRLQLRLPGFWMMTSIGALGGVPIIAWNIANGWVTLLHTQNHAGFEEDAGIHWLGPLGYLGGQATILLGFWFVVWVRSAWHHRPTREVKPAVRFLWWMSVPTFLFFALFSFKNGGGEANWPIAAYLSGMVLAAGWFVRELGNATPWYRNLYKGSAAAFAGLGLLLTVILHEPSPLQPVLLQLAGAPSKQHPMPIRRVDPTARLRGWSYLAGEVGRVRAELMARGIEPVLAAERWTQAAELSFYGAERPTAYCLGLALGDRESQFDLWRPNPVADPAVFQGRTFLLVGLELERLLPAFESFEPAQRIEYRDNGVLIAEWTVVVAHGFRGWSEFARLRLSARLAPCER